MLMITSSGTPLSALITSDGAVGAGRQAVEGRTQVVHGDDLVVEIEGGIALERGAVGVELGRGQRHGDNEPARGQAHAEGTAGRLDLNAGLQDKRGVENEEEQQQQHDRDDRDEIDEAAQRLQSARQHKSHRGDYACSRLSRRAKAVPEQGLGFELAPTSW